MRGGTTRAVAFDLWETLITHTAEQGELQQRARLERMTKIFAGAGHSLDAALIEDAYGQAWEQCHDRYWSLDRDIPCRRQVEHFIEALGLDPAVLGEKVLADVEEVYGGIALDVLPHVVPGADRLLPLLESRGFSIGVISNTGRTPGSVLRQVLDRLGLARSIDAMVFSNEHGACKPQPSIFEALRSQLGTEFHEMVFVGDNLYVDVYGAQRMGMRAIHYNPPQRGMAVARPVNHDLVIEPDFVVSRLEEIADLV